MTIGTASAALAALIMVYAGYIHRVTLLAVAGVLLLAVTMYFYGRWEVRRDIEHCIREVSDADGVDKAGLVRKLRSLIRT